MIIRVSADNKDSRADADPGISDLTAVEVSGVYGVDNA